MKNFLKLAIPFLAVTIFITSCKKDDTPPPVLTFIKETGFTFQNANLAPGDSVKVGFECKSNGSDPLQKLSFTMNEQDAGTYNFGQDVQNLSLETWLIKSALDQDVWVFELVDVNGNTSSVSITLTKDLSLADVEDIEGLVLYAQANTDKNVMYSLAGRTTYTIDEGNADVDIQAKIDFVYYYDDIKSENSAHLSSPGANWKDTDYKTHFDTWTHKNTGYFILDAPFEPAEFGTLTKTKIKTAYDAAVAADPVNAEKKKSKNMAEDKIYLFKTYDEKYGAIKVNSVVAGTTGLVNFDIKIEK